MFPSLQVRSANRRHGSSGSSRWHCLRGLVLLLILFHYSSAVVVSSSWEIHQEMHDEESHDSEPYHECLACVLELGQADHVSIPKLDPNRLCIVVFRQEFLPDRPSEMPTFLLLPQRGPPVSRPFGSVHSS